MAGRLPAGKRPGNALAGVVERFIADRSIDVLNELQQAAAGNCRPRLRWGAPSHSRRPLSYPTPPGVDAVDHGVEAAPESLRHNSHRQVMWAGIVVGVMGMRCQLCRLSAHRPRSDRSRRAPHPWGFTGEIRWYGHRHGHHDSHHQRPQHHAGQRGHAARTGVRQRSHVAYNTMIREQSGNFAAVSTLPAHTQQILEGEGKAPLTLPATRRREAPA